MFSTVPYITAMMMVLSCTSAFAWKIDEDIADSVGEVAALPGEPSSLTAAGMTRSEERILTLEDSSLLDSPKKRLVIVGGLDGTSESARSVIAAIRWFKTVAPPALRRDWVIAALPCAFPSHCSADQASTVVTLPDVVFPPKNGFYNDETAPEIRYVWRWVAFQAADLVLEVRSGPRTDWELSKVAIGVRLKGSLPPAGSLTAALSSSTPSGLAPVAAIRVSITPNEAPGMLENVLNAASALERSLLHDALVERSERSPLEIAELLARRYPETPRMSYIPSVAWSNTLRLAVRLHDTELIERVRRQMSPFLSGEEPTIAEPYRLTSLAGHFAFADFASLDRNVPPNETDSAMKLAVKAAEFILPQVDDDILRFPREWTDDMFMATSLLARVAAITGDERYAAVIGRLLTSYADQLQRPDGLFIHALDGPHAWGRGNGFAILGLMEALTHLPEAWVERPKVLEIYRRHAEALARHQAPDGMWRQVVDEPGSYRELTVTAMTLVALTRGLSLGWLDNEYVSIIDRGWIGLSTHVAQDGTLVDVCTGTGAGDPRRYYLDRAAIFGADDRGGAMALWAAMEIAEFRGQRQ